MSIAATTSTAAPVSPSAVPQTPDKNADAWDFSFKNLLDIVNPLQHIPVISTIYRKLTGDVPATPEKIAGDTLYGGVVGLFSSLADSAFEAVTGKDFGDTMLAFFTGGDKPAATPVAVALNNPSMPAPVAVGAPDSNGVAARTASSANMDNDAARRAAFAYRRSIGMTNALANAY
jgi:hypothetical protein